MVNQQRQRSGKNKLARVGLCMLAFLFFFGLAGGLFIIIEATGKFPPRSDRLVDAWVATKDLSAPTGILVLRGLNRGEVNILYQKVWPESTPGETRFNLGALMEPWLAQMAMMLHDQGKLGLDQPVGTYLPHLGDTERLASIASYLNYSANIPNLLESKPSFVRTSENYRILSQVILAVVGQSPEALIQKEIIDPLEMASTSFRQSGDHETEAATWETTLADLGRWAMVLNSNRLVKMKTYLRGHTPRPLENGGKWPFGFGWSLESWQGLRLEQATGLEPNTNFAIIRVPQKNFTVLVLSQMSQQEFDTANAGREIAKRYLARELPKNYRKKAMDDVQSSEAND